MTQRERQIGLILRWDRNASVEDEECLSDLGRVLTLDELNAILERISSEE